jgi:hypothetical protein
MGNLSLTTEIQEKAKLGKLEVEMKILNSVLAFSVSSRPLIAILTFFANVTINLLPKSFLTNVFKSLMVC